MIFHSSVRSLLLFMMVFFLLLFAPLMAIQSAIGEEISESNQIDIRLDGPIIIGTQQQESYDLRIQYNYPERILNYSYTAKVVGESIFGAEIIPNNGTSDDGTFQFILTGPVTTGEMTIRINATAREIDDISWYYLEEFDLTIFKPISVSANLYNIGESDANKVTVQMFINGDLKDAKDYSVPAGGSVSVSFNWTFSSIPQGEYVVTLVADSSSETIEFSEGNNVFEETIYYSKSGNILRGVLAVLIIFVAVILALTILQKPGPQKKP